ncbi:hypothetical protein DPMN_069861 [Dreissena polymorpha]|uniref:Uncharacterized protein n=1 Tax=Dreissena polymorpha TaxID=45954 RepID=A0A9D3Z0B4_DREPO|nr:hypothetical protein DPMN_069861 [Dreissena polymorpha]
MKKYEEFVKLSQDPEKCDRLTDRLTDRLSVPWSTVFYSELRLVTCPNQASFRRLTVARGRILVGQHVLLTCSGGTRWTCVK